MKTKERKTMWIAIALLIIVLLMSVGFAYYTGTLNIGGTNSLTVKKAAWSVHWNDKYNTNGYKLSEKSQSIGTPTITNTNVSFTTTLNEIGEFAEFTVQAINDGTIDAKLTGITINGLTDAQKNYVTITVDYGGTSYTTNQTNLSIPLDADSTKDVVIRAEYIEPANESLLPATDQTISLSINFNYQSV